MLNVCSHCGRDIYFEVATTSGSFCSHFCHDSFVKSFFASDRGEEGNINTTTVITWISRHEPDAGTLEILQGLGYNKVNHISDLTFSVSGEEIYGLLKEHRFLAGVFPAQVMGHLCSLNYFYGVDEEEEYKDFPPGSSCVISIVSEPISAEDGTVRGFQAVDYVFLWGNEDSNDPDY